MRKVTQNQIAQITDLCCSVQQIPSPTFDESLRGDYILEYFQKEGLREVHKDQVGNVYGCLPGGNRKPLVISAHMDTVFPKGCPLTIKRTPTQLFGPGIGDNSMGVAVLMSIPRLLDGKPQLPGDTWLVANVGEEGLGNLSGMRSLVDHFGSNIAAYLIMEGMGIGHIYHRGLGVERYRLSARTAGGHSWVDYGKPSAVHHLAALVTRITALPVPRFPRTSMNVGVFEGGTTVNTIAAEAWFDLDLRSEDQESLATLAYQVKRLAEMANMREVKVEVLQTGVRPVGEIPADHPLVRLAEKSLRLEGVNPHLEIASTDANIPLSRGYPAICIGLTTGALAHTIKEYLNIEPLKKGLNQLISIIDGIWLI
jgi:tripeptide aminopeptidase